MELWVLLGVILPPPNKAKSQLDILQEELSGVFLLKQETKDKVMPYSQDM